MALQNLDDLRGLAVKVLMASKTSPENAAFVADALIKADKDFDLVVVPGAGHSSGGRYGERRRRDFFVRHLLGKEPRWDP